MDRHNINLNIFFLYKCIVANTSAISYGSKLHIETVHFNDSEYTRRRNKSTLTPRQVKVSDYVHG